MNQFLSIPLEVKSLDKAGQIEGHGSVFGNVDLGGDVVMPGAFDRSLSDHRKSGSMPSMFWMHDPSQVAGAWTDIREDSKGLYVKGQLANTQLGNEMQTLLKMKAVRGLSIGYRTVDAGFSKTGERLLKEVDLWEVSLVSLALNPLAQVEAVKSRLSSSGEYVPTLREFEAALRDVGLSRKVAKHITTKVFSAQSTSEMLDGTSLRDVADLEQSSPWLSDAKHPPEEMLLETINKWSDKVLASSLKHNNK